MTAATIARAAANIRRRGEPVTLRQQTTTPVRTDAAYAAGATAIGLTGFPAGWGGPVAGDIIAAGGAYTVAAPAAPVNGVCSGVAISPPLAAPLAAGQDLALLHASDYATVARVASYDAEAIDGAFITVRDLHLLMMPVDATGTLMPPPREADLVIIASEGVPRAIGVVKGVKSGAAVAFWNLQLKG